MFDCSFLKLEFTPCDAGRHPWVRNAVLNCSVVVRRHGQLDGYGREAKAWQITVNVACCQLECAREAGGIHVLVNQLVRHLGTGSLRTVAQHEAKHRVMGIKPCVPRSAQQGPAQVAP